MLQELEGQGKKLIQQKKYQEAIEVFDKCIKLDPKCVIVHNNKAVALQNLSRFDEAILEYDQCVKLDPKYLIGYYNKGLVLEHQYKFHEAILEFDECIQLNPKFFGAYTNKSLSLRKLSKFEEAKQVYDECIKIEPAKAHVNYTLGVTLENIQRYPEAIREYDECIRSDPNDYNAYYAKGQLLQRQKEFDQAIYVYENLIKMNPSNADAYNIKGMVLDKQQRYAEAIKQYDECIRLEPKNIGANYAKGKALLNTKKFEEAFKVFEYCIQLDPININACYDKAIALVNMNKFEDAVKAFDECIKLDPDNPNPYYSKAFLLQNMKQFDQEVKVYDQCIKLAQNAKNADAYANAQKLRYFAKGQAQQKLERFQEAIYEYDECIKLDSKYTDAYINKALILENQKKLEEASEVYKKVISFDRMNVIAFINRGSVLQQLNRLEESVYCFQQALQFDDKNIIACVSKAELEQQLGQTKNASKTLKQARSLLDDPIATKKLSTSDLKYLRESVDKILFLEAQFEMKAADIEIALQFDVKHGMQAQQQITFEKDLDLLKERKQKIIDYLYKYIQNSDVVFAQQQQNQDQIKEVMIDMQKLRDKIKQIEQDNIELKKATQRPEIYDLVKIQQRFLKYEKISARLNDYQKTFYWTLLDYFNSCRLANTKLIKTNTGKTADDQKKQSKPPQSGSQYTSGLPTTGSIYSAIDQVVGCIQYEMKARKFEDRVIVMNRIIQKNQDTEAQKLEDFNDCLAIAASEIADIKYAQDQGKEKQMMNDQQEIFLWKFTIPIKTEALGQGIELYSTEGGQEALEDILLLILHFTLESEQVIKLSGKQKLSLIITDAVMQKKSIEVIEKITQDQDKILITEYKDRDGRCASCTKCSIM